MFTFSAYFTKRVLGTPWKLSGVLQHPQHPRLPRAWVDIIHPYVCLSDHLTFFCEKWSVFLYTIIQYTLYSKNYTLTNYQIIVVNNNKLM